jgi:hypothetical protein
MAGATLIEACMCSFSYLPGVSIESFGQPVRREWHSVLMLLWLIGAGGLAIAQTARPLNVSTCRSRRSEVGVLTAIAARHCGPCRLRGRNLGRRAGMKAE